MNTSLSCVLPLPLPVNKVEEVSKLLTVIQSHILKNPHCVAIKFNNKSVTYAQLDERSEKLAHQMLLSGILPSMKVGIYLERSIEIIVAIIAIFKRGAAYVPLDPSYPEKRIHYMLTNANVDALLTHQSLPRSFNEIIPKVIYIDNEFPVISHSFINPSNEAKDFNEDPLAYILYTSGTTGAPKGVMVTQNNLINAYRGWENAYSLTEKDVHLQMASFSFDVFAGDLIRALCSGSKLVLCSREIMVNPKALYALMCTEKVTCAEFVPAVLRVLVDYMNGIQQDFSFMRLLICGSDNWSMGEYRKLKKMCGANTRLINSYGLTEATIDSTYFEINENENCVLSDEISVPIGKPFPSTDIYLLDEALKPVTIGMPGEIYIGGKSLSQGYFNQPELTSQKFISIRVEGQMLKLYKTGDLAQFLPDGNIQLIGRADQQVKLKGNRIDLIEIENNLNQHPSISSSLVTIQSDARLRQRLVAYVMFKNTELDKKTLRQFLTEHLPRYMLPSVFIPLQALPLLPNGKIDRNFFRKISLT